MIAIPILNVCFKVPIHEHSTLKSTGIKMTTSNSPLDFLTLSCVSSTPGMETSLCINRNFKAS